MKYFWLEKFSASLDCQRVRDNFIFQRQKKTLQFFLFKIFFFSKKPLDVSAAFSSTAVFMFFLELLEVRRLLKNVFEYMLLLSILICFILIYIIKEHKTHILFLLRLLSFGKKRFLNRSVYVSVFPALFPWRVVKDSFVLYMRPKKWWSSMIRAFTSRWTPRRLVSVTESPSRTSAGRQAVPIIFTFCCDGTAAHFYLLLHTACVLYIPQMLHKILWCVLLACMLVTTMQGFNLFFSVE